MDEPIEPAPCDETPPLRLAGEREEVAAETIAMIVAWQLQHMPQQLRSWLTQRKNGVERVLAHLIVERMTKRGIRFDAPKRDPDGSHCGYSGRTRE